MAIGYLDPKGVLHPCESYGHMELARDLAKSLGNNECKTGFDAELFLQQQGWIVIRSRDVYGMVGYLSDPYHPKHLTDEQASWLLEEYAHSNSAKQNTIDKLFKEDGRH